MAIRVDGQDVYLAVRDLLPAAGSGPMLSSFPLPRRGALGQKAQKYLQRKSAQKGLFHSEYLVSQSYPAGDYSFHLSGRIDGVFVTPRQLELEEIKSVILNRRAFKELHPEQLPHYCEQLLTYALMLSEEKPTYRVKPYLILINLTDLKEQRFALEWDATAQRARLLEKLGRIAQRLDAQTAQLTERQKTTATMIPGLPEKRPQQQQMMDAVTRTVENGGRLLVSAPTGTGKTAAALYPALRYAWAHGKKVLFITPKNSQHDAVRQALQPVMQSNAELRMASLMAARKMCANTVFFCHEDHCMYAKDFKERLDDQNLLYTLRNQNMHHPNEVFQKAKEHCLCPAEVNSELAVRADVVVADYNYVFDPAARFGRLFQNTSESDFVLIIDEAHNLYDRGRGYLSPSLSRRKTELLLEHAAGHKSNIYKNLARALTHISRKLDDFHLQGETEYAGRQHMPVHIDAVEWRELQASYEVAYIAYLIFNVKKNRVQPADPFEAYFYSLQRFARCIRLLDNTFSSYYDAADGGVLHLFCCDPAGYLGSILERFHSVVAMSATLDPVEYYREVLGFGRDADTLQLDSPFPAENRKVLIIPGVSTLFSKRSSSYQRIAEILINSIALKKGNYLAFFPSYDYLQQVKIFMGRAAFEIYAQKPGMNARDVEELLAEMQPGHDKSQLLMAVMGGTFSEGVDFRGEMAIAVFVVSPALPRFGYERQLLQNYYEEKNGSGTAYAYHYPGMNKVIQAAGRLIRGHSEKGIAVLIGERFAEENLNSLLPDYWFSGTNSIIISDDYEEVISHFWSAMKM